MVVFLNLHMEAINLYSTLVCITLEVLFLFLSFDVCFALAKIAY